MTWREVISLVKTTGIEFFQERPLHHGAALSYYALIALIPVLYLSVSFFGSFVGQETMLQIIRDLLHQQIGIADVEGVIDFLSEIDLAEGNWALRIGGIFALLLSSTAILNSLRRSINEFYDLDERKLSRKKMIVKGILSRVFSMAIIAVMTSFIIALYFAETFLLTIEDQYFADKEFMGWLIGSITWHGIPIILNFLVFTVIFKYLHDAYVKWKIAITSGVIIGILLYLGQLMIKYYLSNYFFAADGGVAGAMLIILVWVYYSSQILFFGAKFTFVYARHLGMQIKVRE